MADQTIDYAALAKQFGGSLSDAPPAQAAPQNVDYQALLKQFGGTLSDTAPAHATSQPVNYAGLLKQFGGTLADEPSAPPPAPPPTLAQQLGNSLSSFPPVSRNPQTAQTAPTVSGQAALGQEAVRQQTHWGPQGPPPLTHNLQQGISELKQAPQPEVWGRIIPEIPIAPEDRDTPVYLPGLGPLPLSAVKTVANTITGQATLENAGIMLGSMFGSEALVALANSEKAAAFLKAYPALWKAVDVGSRIAVPATFTGIQGVQAFKGAQDYYALKAAGKPEEAENALVGAFTNLAMGALSALDVGTRWKDAAAAYPPEAGTAGGRPGAIPAEQVGGIASPTSSQQAGAISDNLKAGGNRLAAMAWEAGDRTRPTQVMVDGQPFFISPARTATGKSFGGKPLSYYDITDANGKLATRGSADAIRGWLLQRNVSIPQIAGETPLTAETRQPSIQALATPGQALPADLAGQPIVTPPPAEPGAITRGQVYDTPEGPATVKGIGAQFVTYQVAKPDGTTESKRATKEAFQAMAKPAQPPPATAPQPPAAAPAAATAPYSSTQANLPTNLPTDAGSALLRAGASIPDSQLAPDGREHQPHVTVKYGLHGEDPAPVQKLLEDEPPIQATLGKASIFKTRDADVLKVDVISPDLHRLNQKIADALPHTDTHPTYQPHATIAYLKPGEGAQYDGQDIPGVTGQQITLPSVAFSDKSGQQTDIPLTGKQPNSVLPEPAPVVSGQALAAPSPDIEAIDRSKIPPATPEPAPGVSGQPSGASSPVDAGVNPDEGEAPAAAPAPAPAPQPPAPAKPEFVEKVPAENPDIPDGYTINRWPSGQYQVKHWSRGLNSTFGSNFPTLEEARAAVDTWKKNHQERVETSHPADRHRTTEEQTLRNSIAEGEMILKGKRAANGKPLTKAQLSAIARAVRNSKLKLDASAEESKPAVSGTQEPPAESRKLPTRKEALDKLRDAYTPGNVVTSYGGGLDRVLQYQEGVNALGMKGPGLFRVQVQAVDKNGAPLPGERPRWHSTPPGKSDRVISRAPVAQQRSTLEPSAPSPTLPEPAPLVSGQALGAPSPATNAQPPAFTEGDKVQWTGPAGEKLTGTIDSDYGDGTYQVDRDQIAHIGGKIPIKGSSRVRGEALSHIEPTAAPATTAQAAPLDPRPAAVKLADAVYQKLRSGAPLGNQPAFYKMAELFFRSPRTSGQWDVKDAMDAMEAGVNKLLIERGAELMKMDPVQAIAELRKLQAMLPTQGTRTDEQLKAQQFSTPPAESFVAAKAANLQPTDVVLEPSAGNGGLAVWPKAIGAQVHINEISDRRARMLEAVGLGTPTAHDGEVINALLDTSVKPTVVLMNPPFSSGALKGSKVKNRNQYGFNHVDQALQRLAPGGRLVAILGGGRADDLNGGASLTGGHTGKWFDRLAKLYNIRANVRIDGKEYQKYGTNFATRIVVIDKTGPTPNWIAAKAGKGGIVQGNAGTLEQAYTLLSNVAADRPQVSPGAGSSVRPGQSQPTTGVGTGADAGSDRGGALLPGRGGADAALQPGDRPDGTPGSAGLDRPAESAEPPALQQPGPGLEAPSRVPGAAHPESGAQPDDLRPVRSDGELPGDRQPAAETQLTPREQVTPLTGDEGSPSLAPIEQEDQPLSDQPPDNAAYVPYRPSIKGKPHPGDIVETTTMATVKLPKPTYQPNLPADVDISAVQMEAVQMAAQQNEILLPGGFRAGALIGDGTGVGKGREAAAYEWHNWREGRKRIVYVSKNWDLIQDFMRDLAGVGAGDDMLKGVEKQPNGKFVVGPKSSIQQLNHWNYGAKIQHDGVIYSTYGTVRAKDKKGNRRVAQLEDYLRGDDDGEGAAIVFDEAHTLKNATPSRGSPASQIGQAVKQMLERIPKLRTLSLSATAATDVSNLGYLDRLGLWGPGTPFPNGFQEFQSKIGSGGLSAMEMIARELKAQGKYISRTLSFNGVDYDTAEHALTGDQKELYRTAARAWSVVLADAGSTIENTTNGGQEQKGNFLSQFYGTQQRFFNLLITTLKIPTAVELANQALADGKAVVISLVNTNEAAQNREKNKALGEGDEDEVPDYDFGPKEMLVELVKNHYPTQQYEDAVNDDGDPIKVPMYYTDKDGRELAVQNPTAIAARDALIAQINRDLHMPENPLDILIQSLGGPKKVAELTGRKERFDRSLGKFVPRGDPNVPQKDINLVEMRNFQGGKKNVAVLSAAADTGISLHAGNDVANQKRRFHITLQVGWSADKAMQMLGRTHRTNQVHPPQYTMLVSDLGGEKRFVSTIARRLGSLGALTKGQKNATGGTDLMDKVNFETDQGKQATNTFYERMLADQAVPGTDLTGRQILLDLHVLKQTSQGETVPPAERTNVTRLLNRLLALDPDVQNPVYNYFYDIFQAAVQDAIERGTLDTGVKTMPWGDAFQVKEQRVIATDPKTGAETFYYPVDAQMRTNAVSPEELTKRLIQHATENPTFMMNDKGQVSLTIDAPPIVSADGQVRPAVYASRPAAGKWVKIGRDQFPRGTQEVGAGAQGAVEKATDALQRAQAAIDYHQQYAARNPGPAGPSSAWVAEGLARAQSELNAAHRAMVEAQAIAQNPIAWAQRRWAEQYQGAPKYTTQQHHLIGGAVLSYWNPIRDAGGGGFNIYTAKDSTTGKRIVGVEIDPQEIKNLLQRIAGGASTVNAAQLSTDVLRNGLTYTLEGNIQVRKGWVGREQIIQLIPPNRDVAENLKRMGVVYEKGAQPVYYVPNAATHVPADRTHAAILDKILKEYPVKPEQAAAEAPLNEDRPQFLFDEEGPEQEPLFQREIAGFYSQLQRVIQEKMRGPQSPSQLLSMLRNPQNGVKPDELKWTGLETWLEDQKGKPVTPKQVQDYLKENQVQVQEVQKGKFLDQERIRKADEALALAQADVAARQAANLSIKEGDRVATVGSAPSVGGYTYSTGKIYEAKKNPAGLLAWKLVDAFGGTRAGRSDKFVRELQAAAPYQWLDGVGNNDLVNGRRNPVPSDPYHIQTSAVDVSKLRLAEYEAAAARVSSGTPTKFQQWKTPGGENYRELLLTLPTPKAEYQWHANGRGKWAWFNGNIQVSWAFPTEGDADAAFSTIPAPKAEYPKKDTANYRSPHWLQPNVVAHLRMADYTTADGKKVSLMIEDQSDWHEAGRKKGYRPEGIAAEIERSGAHTREIQRRRDAATGAERDALVSELTAALNAHRELQTRAAAGVPQAPFSKTWHELVFRRALRDAVERGADQFAWTTGDQQVKIYPQLATLVSGIAWQPSTGELYIRKKGETDYQAAPIAKDATADKIADYVGKDAAKNLAAMPVNENGYHEIAGDGLRVGIGLHGMQAFYDQMLPQYAAKYVKKWGATVGETKLKGIAGKVHSIEITPAMRESVMEGQPLFSRVIQDRKAKLLDQLKSAIALRDRATLPGERAAAASAVDRLRAALAAIYAPGAVASQPPPVAKGDSKRRMDEKIRLIKLATQYSDARTARWKAYTDSENKADAAFWAKRELEDERDGPTDWESRRADTDAHERDRNARRAAYEQANREAEKQFTDAGGQLERWDSVETSTPDSARPVQLIQHGSTILTNRQSLNAIVNRWGARGIAGVKLTRSQAVQAVETLRAAGEHHLADAILRAAQHGDGSVAIADSQKSLQAVKATLRHERFHQTQQLLQGHLRSQEQAFLNLPEARIAAAPMLARGYRPSEMAAEIGARLAAGQYESLGLTREEAKVLGRAYLEALEAEHGPEKVEQAIRNLAPIMREVQRARSARLERGTTGPGGTEPAQVAPGQTAGQVRSGVRRAVSGEAGAGSPQFQLTAPAPIGKFHQWLRGRFGSDAPKANYTGLTGLTRTLLPGRNLAEVEAASRKVFESALPAASSDAITSTILMGAIPAIRTALKGSGHLWEEQQLYYIESRLQGLSQRWMDFGQQAEQMSEQDLQTALQPTPDGEHSPFLDLLHHMEGKAGFNQNLAQAAAAIAEARGWPTLREFLSGSFYDAAARVAQMMPPDQFNAFRQAIADNPQVKEADRLYGELIEKPMAESHAINEGVFSNALGPANRYYPLVPIDKDQVQPPGRRLTYHKPQNAANKFATGLSKAYDPGMEALRTRLTLGNRGNYKAALIARMEQTGWIAPESKAYRTPERQLAMTGPDGEEYAATRVEVGQARTLIQNGRVVHLPARFRVMPTFMNRGLAATLEREPMDPDAVISGMRWANMLATKGPLELVFHSAGVLGALYSNTPFLGGSGLDKALSVPLMKWFAIRAKLFQTDPTTPENVAKLHEMAKAGAVPSKTGKFTYSKDFAKMTGAKLERLSFGPMLYGPKGIDARARIVMYDIWKAAYPNGTASDLHHFVNQIGNYTPEMQGVFEQAVKKIGMGPFATAGMTRIVNGVNSWTGAGPQKGQTLESHLWWWLTASAWIALAAWTVAHKHLTGLYPWQDTRAQLFQLPVGGGNGYLDHFRHSDLGNALWGHGPEVGYLNFAYFDNPLALRGARAMGMADAFKEHQLGGNLGQTGEAMQKGVMNAFAHPVLGPASRAIFVGATGESPYITGLRDRGSIALRMYPAIPAHTPPGLPTIRAKAWAAAKQLNSFYTEGAENLGELTGFGQAQHTTPGSWWAKEAANILTPGFVGNATNPWKAANAIRQEQRAERMQH